MGNFCKFAFITVIVQIMPFLISGCSKGAEDGRVEISEEVLVSVGDSSLLLDDVIRRIPSGLAEEDSVAMFHSIVSRWVRNMVLADVARNSLDGMEEIERMAEDYKNDLIVARYISSLKNQESGIPESKIKEYYAAHHSELILDAPIIKGVYLKVADSNDRLDDLRRWMSTGSESSADWIEKYGLRRATQYDYFPDRWHDWNLVAEQIPYRFFDADAFVEGTKDFETSYGGSIYFLHISDYVLSGSEMPYEYAKSKIEGILRQSEAAGKRDNMLMRIYRDRIKEGGLVPGSYDPVSGKMRPSR